MAIEDQLQSNLSSILPDLYSNSFQSLHPRQAHNIISSRLREAKQLNDDLADYFRDRHSIEDHYIKSLIKLSKKSLLQQPLRESPPTLSSSLHPDPVPSSIETQEAIDGNQLFRNLLDQELNESIDRHAQYLSQLHSQVEHPLRNSKTLGQPNQPKLRSLDDQLLRIVRSYEDSESRLHKSTSKLNSSSNLRKIQTLQTRYSEDQQSFLQSKQTWSLQSQQILKIYQSIDHDRLVDLQETLTRFETLQVDHSRQQMEIYERSAGSLLTFDPREDMQRFVLLNGSIPNTVRPTLDQSSSSVSPPSSHHHHPSIPSSSPVIKSSSPVPTHSPQTTLDSGLPDSKTPLRQALEPSTPTLKRSIQASQTPQSTPTPVVSSTLETHSDQPASDHDRPSQDQTDYSLPSSSRLPPARSTPSPSKPWSNDGAVYDPNHPEIPQLNAPNISVPIRSRPGLTSHQSDSPLPPRTLYVQRQNSNASLSSRHPNESTAQLSRSQKSYAQPMKSTNGPQSITDKLFSRSRITNMLSRNPNNNLGPSPKPSSARRLSQTADSLDNTVDRATAMQQSSSRSTSRQHRSSSVMAANSRTGLYALDQSQLASASQTGLKPNWSTTRLAQFLPGSAPLLKSKTSYSNRLRNKPSLPKPNLKVDSEGFTIPPENRDRMPWGQEGDTEVLSVSPLEGPTHQFDSPKNDSQDNDDGDRPATSANGFNSFAIKSSPPAQTSDTEAERQAAIQKVQNTLASSVGSTLGAGHTRRQNAALRGRRGDGRGATMYDVSPGPAFKTSSPLIRRGTVADRAPSPKPDPLSTNPIKSHILPVAVSSSHSNSSQHEQLATQPFESPNSNTAQPLPPSSSNSLNMGNSFSTPADGTTPSRSNSITSAISSLNSTTFGFQSILPVINGAGPTICTSPIPTTIIPPPTMTPTKSTNKNPFLSMSSSSNLSNDPSSLTTTDKTSPGIGSISGASSQLMKARSQPHLSINENLNVLMDQGRITKLLVIGEVNIMKSFIDRVFHSASQLEQSSHQNLRFRIHHFDRLEKVVFPDGLVSPVRSSGAPQDHQLQGEFELDMVRFRAICSGSPGHSDQDRYCILKYRLYFDSSSMRDHTTDDGKVGIIDQNIKRYLPLVIIPRWRTTKDKTELVINYKECLEFRDFYHEQQKQEDVEAGGSDEGGSSDEKKKIGRSRTLRMKDYEDVMLERFELSTMIFNPELDKSHTKKLKIIDQQSLPVGKFDNHENRMQWNLSQVESSKSKSDLNLNPNNDSGSHDNVIDGEDDQIIKKSMMSGIKVKGLDGKVICRFIHDPEDSKQLVIIKDDEDELDKNKDQKDRLIDSLELRQNCGPIHVKWNLNGINLTGIRIEILHDQELLQTLLNHQDHPPSAPSPANGHDDHGQSSFLIFNHVSTSTFLCR